MQTAAAVAVEPAGRVEHVSHPETWLAWVGLALAAIAGFVDAIGYLGLFRLYIAHMTGNTASGGADLGRLEWANALHSLVPVPMFLLGVCLGAVIKQEGIRHGARSWFALTCGLEALLLALMIVIGSGPAARGALVQNSADYFALVVLPCLAMGIQSATFQRVGSVAVRTTFVTGILTGLGEEVVAAFYGRRQRRATVDQAEGVAAGPAHGSGLERATLFAGIWFAYLVGGALAGVGQTVWQLSAVVVPVLALAGLAVLDLVHPLQPRQHVRA